jgi:hypothetical protein
MFHALRSSLFGKKNSQTKRRAYRAPLSEALESREVMSGNPLSSGLASPVHFPNGTYIRDTSTGATDVIQNGQRCWLSPAAYDYLWSPTSTNVLGNPHQILNLSDAAFRAIPAGPNYMIST